MLNEIKVYFIDTNENEIDALMIETRGASILNARIYLIYQRICVLKMISPINYGNTVETSFNYDDIKKVIKKLNN